MNRYQLYEQNTAEADVWSNGVMFIKKTLKYLHKTKQKKTKSLKRGSWMKV